MITNQLMKREFGETVITQRTKDKYFNATELLRYHNTSTNSNKVMAEFWSNKQTIAFMDALENQIQNDNIGDSLHLKTDLFETKRGKNGATWMHPYLFVKFAMWISSDFEVKVIKWVYDNLIDFRTQAGDHYKEMCSAIKERFIEYYGIEKIDPLVFINEARFLNLLVFGDDKEKTRNDATEQQLELMNKLQLANVKLIKQGLNKAKRQEMLRMFADMYR